MKDPGFILGFFLVIHGPNDWLVENNRSLVRKIPDGTISPWK